MYNTKNEFTQKYFYKNYNTINFWASQLLNTQLPTNTPFVSLPPLMQKLIWDFAIFKIDN